MAASQHFLSRNKVNMYDHDPADSTVATDVAWVDMRDYTNFVAIAFASALTGTGVIEFLIIGNSESDGSGTDAIIKTHALGSAPDAVGDYVMLECTAEEIAAASTSSTGQLRYVSAKLDCDNAADENVVVYIRSGARFPTKDLSSDTVA